MTRIRVQLNQDEPDTIEFIIADENCHFAAYFGLNEWENFKKAVNKFNIDHDLGVIAEVRGEDTGLKITVSDLQMADVTIEFGSNSVNSMIDFGKIDWKKFKTDINTFKVSKVEVGV